MMTARLAMVSGVMLAALGLAACSGEADSGTVDAAEVTATVGDLVKPQAGQYETSGELVKFEIPGMSDQEKQMMRGFMEQGFTQKVGFCLTAEEAEKGFEQAIREMRNDDSNACEFTRFDVSGNTLASEMKCDDGSGNSGTISMDGNVTETSQDMTMTFDQTSADLPGGAMQMVVKMKSQRVGECS
ncbi:DUF3617 domain-containing protein [Altererythrobacter sp.]|nr:DUF3617 domain-containing protein [Altererythrobacter sp.]